MSTKTCPKCGRGTVVHTAKYNKCMNYGWNTKQPILTPVKDAPKKD